MGIYSWLPEGSDKFLNIDEIRERVKEIHWTHILDLGEIVTPACGGRQYTRSAVMFLGEKQPGTYTPLTAAIRSRPSERSGRHVLCAPRSIL
jgi:hypothetical protein